jgi:hypothetical protein
MKSIDQALSDAANPADALYGVAASHGRLRGLALSRGLAEAEPLIPASRPRPH